MIMAMTQTQITFPVEIERAKVGFLSTQILSHGGARFMLFPPA